MVLQNIVRLLASVRRSNFCCNDLFGIGSMVSSGISSAANLTATKLTNQSNERNVDRTNSNNLAIAREVNDTNMSIAEANNQTAIDIHREDNAFNAAEAQKQREWDSIGEQRKRMIEAGYNPLMVTGFSDAGGSAASASASPSLDTPQLQGANMVAPNSKPLDFSGFADIVGKYFQMKDAEAGINFVQQKAEGQRLDNMKSLFEVNHLEDRWYSEQELKQWQEDEHTAKMFNFYLLGKRYQSEEAKNWADTFYTNKLANEVDVRVQKEKQNIAFALKINEKQLIRMDEELKNIRAQRSEIYARASAATSQARLNDSLTDLNEIDAKTREESNKAVIRQMEIDTTTQMIRNSTVILNSDLSNEEKDLVSSFLANHPDCTASEFFACMKDVESAPNKDWSRKWNLELWETAKAIVVGGIAAGIVVASGGTALAAGAAALGGIGAAKSFGVGSSTSSSVLQSPSVEP